MEDIIRDFIDWAKENSPDAWWIYEETDEAIEKYAEYLKSELEEN